MEIKKLQEQDFITVREFYWDLIDKMECAKYRPGWEKNIYPTDDFILESLKNGELFALFKDGNTVGVMIINHECNEGYNGTNWMIDAKPEEISVIHALGVMPDYQGNGTAKLMVNEAIKIAKESNQKAIRLDVLGGNLPAMKLYEGLGFEKRRTVTMFYEDTGWTEFVLYELVL